MRTRDIMTSPPITVTPDAHVKEVADLLVRRQVSALPVVEEGRLVGIVSEADLVPLEAVADLRAHAIRKPEPAARAPRLVREVMTRDVLALPPDADAADAARLMLAHGVKSIPIVSGPHVVGIVSRRDLLKVLARDDRDIRNELLVLLEGELGTLEGVSVDVRDGSVTLAGPLDPPDRKLAELLARTVPGVVGVTFSGAAGAPAGGGAGSPAG